MDGAAYEIFVARSLESIIQEIDPGYSGSRSLIEQQQKALPGETAAQLDGLNARAERAHTDILDGARRRGLGFGGIPIGEQVKYDSTEFKPAVANLYAAQNTRRQSLDEALNAILRDQRSNAMSIRESELNREEQQRQFNEAQAANRAAAAQQTAGIESYFNQQQAAAAAAQQAAGVGSYGRNENVKYGGWWFKDASGKPIGAATFAKLNGKNPDEVLRMMANAGDTGALNYFRDRNTIAGKANSNEARLRMYNLL